MSTIYTQYISCTYIINIPTSSLSMIIQPHPVQPFSFHTNQGTLTLPRNKVLRLCGEIYLQFTSSKVTQQLEPKDRKRTDFSGIFVSFRSDDLKQMHVSIWKRNKKLWLNHWMIVNMLVYVDTQQL